MKVSAFFTVVTLGILLIGGACNPKSGSTSSGARIKTVTVNNLTVTLSSESGQLKQGDQELILAFADAAGKPVDVGAASLVFHMPAMGPMAAMNETVTLTTTDTPGVYRGEVDISMAGEWQAQLAFEGPAGSGKTTFSVTAR